MVTEMNASRQTFYFVIDVFLSHVVSEKVDMVGDTEVLSSSGHFS